MFDAPTATLDRFHAHITTLNPGQNTGPLHRHPQEELVIIREGTLEVNIDGKKSSRRSGFAGVLRRERKREHDECRQTPATYTVLQWYTPLTPKS